MRMWMLDPALLCRKHLLGEHVECHMIAGALRGGRMRLDGFTDAGLVELASLRARHDALAREMVRRGYRHASPLLPVRGSGGRVDPARSARDLVARCRQCGPFPAAVEPQKPAKIAVLRGELTLPSLPV